MRNLSSNKNNNVVLIRAISHACAYYLNLSCVSSSHFDYSFPYFQKFRRRDRMDTLE